MIAAHSAFLTWALRDNPKAAAKLPRIPTRRAAAGGFSDFMRLPAARQVATHWWQQAIDRVSD